MVVWYYDGNRKWRCCFYHLLSAFYCTKCSLKTMLQFPWGLRRPYLKPFQDHAIIRKNIYSNLLAKLTRLPECAIQKIFTYTSRKERRRMLVFQKFSHQVKWTQTSFQKIDRTMFWWFSADVSSFLKNKHPICLLIFPVSFNIGLNIRWPNLF